MVLNGDLRLFHLTINFLSLANSADPDQRLCSVASVCQCPIPGFTDNPLYTAL